MKARIHEISLRRAVLICLQIQVTASIPYHESVVSGSWSRSPLWSRAINNRDNIASYHQSQLPVPTLLPTTTTKPFHVADPHFWIAILLRLQLTNNSSIQNNQQSSPCPRKRPPSVPPRPKPRRRRRVSLPQQFTFTCAMFTDFFQIPTRLSVASPRTCSSPMSSVRTSVMRTLASASVWPLLPNIVPCCRWRV